MILLRVKINLWKGVISKIKTEFHVLTAGDKPYKGVVSKITKFEFQLPITHGWR